MNTKLLRSATLLTALATVALSSGAGMRWAMSVMQPVLGPVVGS